MCIHRDPERARLDFGLRARPPVHGRAGEQGRAPGYSLPAAFVFVCVVVTGVGLHLGLKRYRWLLLLTLRPVGRRRWYALRRGVRRFIDALLVFERAKFVARALVATAAAFFSASAFQAIALAVGVDLPVQVWCAVVPLFSLFGLLRSRFRVSSGAQAVHVFLLAGVAVAVRRVFAVSALYAVLNILLYVVLGAVAWMLGSNEITKRAIATPGPSGWVTTSALGSGLRYCPRPAQRRRH